MLDSLGFLIRTTLFVVRRPKLRRDSVSVLTEYSDGWNHYWDHLRSARTLDEWLRVPGLEDRPKYCNRDGRLRFEDFDSGNYYRQALAKALSASFPSATSVTEYGSGLGRNLLFLKTKYPNLALYGYELCLPGVEIARKAAEKFGIECQYSQLNFVSSSADRYVFPPTDVAFTMFALEQIPHDNKRAVRNILEHCVAGSIHIEPVVENYPLTPRGVLGRLDHWKVGYLSSFDHNVRTLGLRRVTYERLMSSHNPLMYPSVYTLLK